VYNILRFEYIASEKIGKIRSDVQRRKNHATIIRERRCSSGECIFAQLHESFEKGEMQKQIYYLALPDSIYYHCSRIKGSAYTTTSNKRFSLYTKEKSSTLTVWNVVEDLVLGYRKLSLSIFDNFAIFLAIAEIIDIIHDNSLNSIFDKNTGI
jgi:hypothetical protein